MRRFAVAPLALLLFFGVVAIAGSAASATPKASKSSIASGPQIPKHGGEVNFTGYSNNDGPTSTAVLTGVIGDYGHAVRTAVSGSSTQDTELKLTLSRGSFRLDIAGIEGELVKAVGTGFPTDQTTCSGLESVIGVAPIATGSGTGAYKGLQGSIHLKISINEVESWPTCPKDDTAPFLAQSVFITGSGSVSLK